MTAVPLLPGVDHLRHTHDLSRNAFVQGQPEHGADLAEPATGSTMTAAMVSAPCRATSRSRSSARSAPCSGWPLVALHGAETIAAVIVEPVAGSTGVLVPPKGYLERPLGGGDEVRRHTEIVGGEGRAEAPEPGDDLVEDHAETIAAVIVEPVAGSTGVLVPPKGYLERLRAIASRASWRSRAGAPGSPSAAPALRSSPPPARR
jgi:adenosylmethionine-8-amino-7-oxononanoate aminotransferase